MEYNTPHFKDYMDIILKNKKWIILGVLIPILAAGIVINFIPQKYQASVILYVDAPRTKTFIDYPQNFIIETTQASVPIKSLQVRMNVIPFPVSVKTCEAILTSEEMYRDILKSLDIKDISVKQLGKMLKAESVLEYQTYNVIQYAPLAKLGITVNKIDKDMAIIIVDKWAELFMDRLRSLSERALRQAYNRTLEQYEISKSDLSREEEALLKFESLPKENVDPIKNKIEYYDIKEKVENARDSYQISRQRLHLLKIAVEENSPTLTICARSLQPCKIARPKRSIVLFLAACAGAAFSVFFIFLQHHVKKTL